MTTTTMTNEITYTVEVPVRSYITITTTQPAGLSRDEVIKNITREEMSESDGEMTWDDIKEAFRGDTEDFYVSNQESGEVVA